MDNVFNDDEDNADGGNQEAQRDLGTWFRHLTIEQKSEKTGGAKGIRTPDLLHAMHAGFV
jgi:hypothetical protein